GRGWGWGWPARAARGIRHQPGGSGRRRGDRSDPAGCASRNRRGASLPRDRVGHAGSARAGGADAGRLTTGGGSTMTPHTDNGIIDARSQHSVEQTVERLTALLHAKGVTVFALVDHSGEAAKVGMKLPPTKLLIFGNPKAGTPLMLAAPSVAIDLPLKILVWEDVQGRAWLSYNSPAYLQERHGVPEALLPNIAVVEALVRGAGE